MGLKSHVFLTKSDDQTQNKVKEKMLQKWSNATS